MQLIGGVVLAALVTMCRGQVDNMLALHNLGLPKLPELPQLHPWASAGLSAATVPEGPKLSCTCGVFLSGQFKKGSSEPPKGNSALLQELSETTQCGPIGEKYCTNRCLEAIVKHLPNSGPLICGSIDRDCFKERAYLFIKNCQDQWVNTNLSAGREYCCKEGSQYKCPSNL